MALICPSEAALLQHVINDGLHEDRALLLHIASCPDCGPRVAGLRSAVAAVDAVTDTKVASVGVCLDELAVADFMENGAGARRDPRVVHLAACGHCRHQLAALVALLAESEIVAALSDVQKPSPPGRRPRNASLPEASRPTAVPQRHAVRRWIARTAAIAAAAALLFIVLPRAPQFPGEHRGPTITAGTIPRPLSPAGDVIAARSLQWTAVSGADRYRVTLFDVTGNVLLERELADTVLALPDSVTIVPQTSYLWKVEARTGVNRWAASELTEFRVRQKPITYDAPSVIPTRASVPGLTAFSRALFLRPCRFAGMTFDGFTQDA
jgi:hypothetical protein